MSLIMDKEVLLQGFDKYYNTLIKIGYVPDSIVNDFIIATWITDMVSGLGGVLLTSEEYDLLNKLYNCVEGSCLVPYDNYCNNVTVNLVPYGNHVRITENAENRFTENNNLRTL